MLHGAVLRLTAMSLGLLQTGSAIASPADLQLYWADLAGHIRGHRISLDLPDGNRLEGRVLAVKPDGLEMEVSGKARSIPRSSVQRLTLEKKNRNTKLIGAGVGGAIMVGTAGAGYASNSWSGLGVAIVGTAIGLGVIVTSLIVGHTARKSQIAITIIG